MKPHIELVTDEISARACRRFWYDVYVLEMGRHRGTEPLVDHSKGELSDPLQPKADLFAAWVGGEVVGTLQSAYARHGQLAKYIELYNLVDQSSEHIHTASITNKLMVAKPYRATGLAFHLGVETYKKGLRDGIQTNYIDCNDYLVDFYRRLGYREHLGWIDHKDYGRVYSMVFSLHDEANLRRTRSPLLRVFTAFNQTNPTGEIKDEQVA
ncbi:MAG: hypothetical protein AAGA84_10460 [Pseudomonadota bacterium]